MPLYEYRCDSGHTTEVISRMSERTGLVACALCREPAARILSLPVVHGFTPHYDEFAGMHFESHQDKRRKLAAKGWAEKGDTGIRDKRGRIYSVAGTSKRGSSAVPYLN